jgi:hypothetical protein
MNQRQERVRKASKTALDGLLGVLGLPSFRKDQLDLIISCEINRFDTWAQFILRMW